MSCVTLLYAIPLRFFGSQGTNVAFMSKYVFFSLVLGLGCLTLHSAAQAQAKPSEPKSTEIKSAAPKLEMTAPDYSKEAFIDEEEITKDVFENDGTSKRESLSRVRIQSGAGVQRFSVLTFSYQSAIESIDIDYVRVTKPDNTVVTTPAENVQDMPSEITRQAPFYSDLREKHVAVKGLGVGDVLEWSAHWNLTKPLAPGQFWSSYNFTHDGIVLHQEVQVSVPKERALKWKSPGIQPKISDEGSRRIFTWVSSQVTQKSSEQEKKAKEETVYRTTRGKLPPPDVQISTFQSWAEIGAWYNSLQQKRVKPSEEIRAKAAELTKNAKDDDAKLRAIYAYISTQFRYIGVAFGIGRYQPHSAGDVMGNQYGDCKDKHTLLASLLEAVGFQVYPALINTFHELDAEVPSPSQFDHVITAVAAKNGYTWLDSTAEVAPFGYLLSVLRDKPALAVQGNNAKLVTTPAEPPMKALQDFQMDAKLADDGTLTGKVERSWSGDDAQIFLRAGFRKTPMSQWKDLVQQISYMSGFSGEVSDVNVSRPEKTDEPFRITYAYTRKDYPQWSEHRISAPTPNLILPAADDVPTQPFYLGDLGEVNFESRVETPKEYIPQLPRDVGISDSFASYSATYRVKDGALCSSRKLVVKAREVPTSEYEVYKKFSKAVAEDRDVYIGFMLKHINAGSYQEAIWSLPYSQNSGANDAYEEARQQYTKSDSDAEIGALKRAVEADPKFTRAWLWMGEIYAYQRKDDLALDAIRSAIANDPLQPLCYKGLAFRLARMRKYGDAIPIWQQLMNLSPNDPDGPSNLGAVFIALKRYSEAVVALEAAIKLAPDRAPIRAQMASAYLLAGNQDKAVEAYKKAVELDPSPQMFNNVGYEMADKNVNLPLSLEYAQQAVKEEEEASGKIKLSDLKKEDLPYTSKLTAYWDTLGWVYFRMGDLSRAEKYLSAAWQLGQYADIGDHLGQVYEHQHKKEDAIRMYRLAVAASRFPGAMKETEARLDHLGGKQKTSRSGVNDAGELSQLRTIKIGSTVSDSATAEFFVLFGPDAKVEETKFVSGSEKLKDADKLLRSAPFKTLLPDDGPTKLLRRGVLSCSLISGCNVVLYTPDSVRSIN